MCQSFQYIGANFAPLVLVFGQRCRQKLVPLCPISQCAESTLPIVLFFKHHATRTGQCVMLFNFLAEHLFQGHYCCFRIFGPNCLEQKWCFTYCLNININIKHINENEGISCTSSRSTHSWIVPSNGSINSLANCLASPFFTPPQMTALDNF